MGRIGTGKRRSGGDVSTVVIYKILKKFKKHREQEMAKQLRVLTVLAEDPSSAPSIHTEWFTTCYNSSSRGSLACNLLYSSILTHILTHQSII